MSVPARAAVRIGVLGLGLSCAAGCLLTTSLDGFADGPAGPTTIDGAAETASDATADRGGETAVPAEDAGFRVDHVRLVNLASTTAFPGFDPLKDGAVLSRASFGNDVTLEAITSPPNIGSVAFLLDGKEVNVENVAPYTITPGTGAGMPAEPWTIPLGTHVLVVKAYAGAMGAGAEGTSLTVSFEGKN